ncbi:MAG: UDP-N-acetylmuramoyl-tripeptide--D-alanyl-D-alanine ligase [Firmicutes bacterium]|nr:UDP-N-acetylmuramoyl-tripeptide--D-alanyl-D-alanine ligase [Bacillota bacterium]
MRLSYGQLAAWSGGRLEAWDPDAMVADMVIDSRAAGPGGCFWALPGEHTHGRLFVHEAWARGAVAACDPLAGSGGPALRLADPLEGLGRFLRAALEAGRVTVVGVTGSVGKTSVKELTAAALRSRFRVAQSEGNYNTAIGLPLSFFRGPEDATHFVAEMGMRGPGEIRALTRLARPRVAIITTIGPSHLERLGSLEAIADAKAEILDGLEPGGVAILNRDDPRVWALAARVRQGTVVGVGEAAGDVRVRSVETLPAGTRVELEEGGRTAVVTLPWLGRHQALNAALAAAAARVLGLGWPEVVQGLEAVEPGRARLRRQTVGRLTVLEDVYNASPASMEAALKVLEAAGGRRVAVLGDMLELGSLEEAGHRTVGSRAGTVAEVVVAVGRRARALAEAATAAGQAQVYWEPDAGHALERLQAVLAPGDTVLFKASRAMAFERLVEAVRAWGGPA